MHQCDCQVGDESALSRGHFSLSSLNDCSSISPCNIYCFFFPKNCRIRLCHVCIRKRYVPPSSCRAARILSASLNDHEKLSFVTVSSLAFGFELENIDQLSARPWTSRLPDAISARREKAAFFLFSPDCRVFADVDSLTNAHVNCMEREREHLFFMTLRIFSPPYAWCALL